MVDSDLELWKAKDHCWLRLLFEELKGEYRETFHKDSFVSGDPNSRNWDINDEGELVLFDWERVGLSDPASDLMGIAFGQPKQEVFDNISRFYLKSSRSCHLSVKELSRKVQIARVHISLAISKDYLRSESHIPDEVAEIYRTSFLSWLKETFY